MLLRIKKANLETLLKAVQSKGAVPGGCVMIPSMASCAGLAPHVLLCQLFRWPDLQSDWDLKRLPFCTQHHEENIVRNKDPIEHHQRLFECCNPYHWSRTVSTASSGKIQIKIKKGIVFLLWEFIGFALQEAIHENHTFEAGSSSSIYSWHELDGSFSFIQLLSLSCVCVCA